MKSKHIINWNPFKKTPVAAASPVSKQDMDIMLKMVQEFKDRSRRDIQSYVQATAAAEYYVSPRWNFLQDLYDYLTPDGNLGSAIDILKGTILSQRYYIKDAKTGKENQDKTKIFEKEWFYNLIWNTIDYHFRGYTVMQLLDPVTMKFSMLERRNIVPQKGYFYLSVYEDLYIDYRHPDFQPWIIEVINPYKFGILNDIVRDLIWKKNSKESWAEFSEKFGIPLVSATTPSRDKKEISRIEAMLKLMGEAASVVLPVGSTITIHDSAAKGDPYKVYLEQINHNNDEVNKRILGGTMMNSDGSSRSQSEVHERTLNNILAEQLRKRMEFMVNGQLIPMMMLHKIEGLAEGDEFVYDRSQKLPLDKFADIVSKLGETYEIPVQWISDTFNIPVTGLKAAPITPPENFNKAAKALGQSFAASGILWPNYKSKCSHAPFSTRGEGLGMRITASINIPGLKDLTEIILKNLYADKATLKEQIQKSILTGSELRDGLYEGWGKRRLQIDYEATDNRALGMMEYNLFKFSALREKANVFALNQLLIDKEKNEIRSFVDFRNLATPLENAIDITHLETEYNFAVAAGQEASRYNQFMSEKDTVTSFVQYQTVGDDRVRPAHEALNGRVFSLNDPEARRLWPPNDWNCRCEFIQFMDDVKGKLTSGEEGVNLIGWNEDQKKEFGINRGDVGEVFTANQMYIKDAGLADDINSMTYDNYDLQKWDDAKNNYKNLSLDNSITENNVHELFTPEEGKDYMGFKDYLGRNLILKQDDFILHSTRAKDITEERHKLFPFIKDVISKPDEVYFYNYKQNVFETNYIKFYNNKALVITTNMGSKNLEIKTWFDMKGLDKTVRKGLLIYQKK